ncbi:MAG: hypothetical protein FJY10_08020 [Bacteroidetes bacterium]|nr:hypothetical protein [Bacteroidota bacterium]
MKRKFTFILLMLIASGVSAQWSSDPSVNTFVAGSGNNHTYPLITADPSGSFYISSVSSVPNTYFNYHLQRIDGQGNPLWGTNGKLISDNQCDTWISRYDLVVDTAGNAIMTLDD